MKKLMTAFSIAAILTGVSLAHAEDETPATPADGVGLANSEDAKYDSNDLNSNDEAKAGGKRTPSNVDLPYSKDELEKNSPENYPAENMPIDKD